MTISTCTLSRRPRLAAAGMALALALSACGGGDGTSGGNGTLRLSLTDAPACGFDAVNVTITQLRVHKSSTAAATDAGWVDIPITVQRRDLLTLQNGLLATLGQTPLLPGKYTQMRLLLADNASAAAGQPIPNSVLPTGGSEVALTTPSAQQTGLKMNVDIDIASDQMADFVLDFNACKSVVAAGASGRYQLKPVVSVTPKYVSGVRGSVDAAAAAAGTLVMLEQAGTGTTAPVVVKATAPDSSGNYLLSPVAPGTYHLVVTSSGRATAVVTGVVVQADTVTLMPGAINAPASASANVAGSVTSATTPVDATLAATQVLSGGAVIEVAGTTANTSTGAYAFTLPVGAVSVAPYSVTSLSFAGDASTAGKVTVAASSGGITKWSSLLTLLAGGAATANFSFP